MTIIYLVFILLAIVFSFQYDGVEEYDSHKSHRYWLLCGLLVCISGFSYGLGGDKFAYMETFEEMPTDLSLTETIYFEMLFQGYMPLWTVFTLFVKKTFDSFYVIQFVHALVVNVTFCYYARKYTKRWFLFLLLYFVCGRFFQFNTEVMREAIALSFSLIAFEACFNKKWIAFVSCFVVGLMFHISACMMLFFPFIHFKVTWKTLPTAFFTAFVLWFVSDFLVVHAAIFASAGTLGAFIQKILLYSSQASTIFGFLRSSITYLIAPFIIMYFTNTMCEDEELKAKQNRLIAYTVFLSVIASAFAGFGRFRNYAEVYYLAFFAEFVYMLFRVREHFFIRLGTVMVTAFLVTLQYMLYYPLNRAYFYQLFVPYTCIFNEDRSVYFRADIHGEATQNEETDNNTRDVKNY